MDRIEFEEIVKAQDDLINALDVNVWIGMEPTFTRRFAETPEWLSEALGPEKLQYAYALSVQTPTRRHCITYIGQAIR